MKNCNKLHLDGHSTSIYRPCYSSCNYYLAMIHYFILLIIVYFSKCSAENDNITDGTDLLFVFLVHRHGDRTPINYELSFSKDPDALAQMLDQYDTSHLTPAGQIRGYRLGQYLRRRYSSLLSPSYNRSEIYVKSTDLPRTKMTAIEVLKGLYSTKEGFRQNTPYAIENVFKDFLTPFSSCPKYINYLQTFKAKLPQFQDVLDKWSQIAGVDVSSNLFQTYILYTDYESLHSLGLQLIDPLEEIWTEIKQVANAILEILLGNEDTLPMLTGVLLNEFFKTVFPLVSPNHVAESPRVRIYSGHDLNVYGLVAGSMVPKEARPGPPEFASAFALELRRVVKTGEYVVLPVYLPDPNKEDILYLPIQDCDLLCEINRFKNITSEITLNKKSWKKNCPVA